MNVASQCAVAWVGGTGGAVYMNGASMATGLSATTFTFSSIFTLGSGSSYNGYEPYTGLIDHVKIYNRVLSANEIAWENAEPFSIFAPIVRRQFYFSPYAPTTLIGDVSHHCYRDCQHFWYRCAGRRGKCCCYFFRRTNWFR